MFVEKFWFQIKAVPGD